MERKETETDRDRGTDKDHTVEPLSRHGYNSTTFKHKSAT